MKKGKLWGLLFLALAFFTVWAVISQSKNFSFAEFLDVLHNSSAGWMLAAICSMLCFILFEGMAILCILKAFGYRRNFCKGFLYSSADIYFSSITPSATGGQPASAFFMMKDGIPGAVITISLLANLIMYVLALLTVGTVGIILKAPVFFRFHLLSKLFIIFGYVILWGLAIGFCMMIIRPRILEKICKFFLKLGKKLHLVRHEEKKREKLHRVMKEYRKCAGVMASHKLAFLKVFLLNLLQRLSQITVTLMVFLAIGGKMEQAADIWFAQSFVAIGTYSVPIPGGMGVADYLLIDGFGALFDETTAVHLELISRGVSFYVCMIVSALVVLAGMIYINKRRNLR